MNEEEFGPLPRWRRESGLLVSEGDRVKLNSIAVELERSDIPPPRRQELLDSLQDIAARYSPDPRFPPD